MRSEGIVYIVDDEEPVRKALSLLMRSEGIESKAYASAQEFLDDYDADRPSCLVLDVRMPEMNGLELQDVLISKSVHIPICFITANGDIPMTVRAMKGGAREFFEKPFNNQVLLNKIQEYLEKEIVKRQEQRTQSDTEKRLASLTPREREVTELLIKGMRNKHIAAELQISTRTVESHRAQIMRKLGLKTVSELVHVSLSRK